MKYLILLLLLFVLSFRGMAQQKLKLRSGRVTRCNVYRICDEGIIFKKDTSYYFTKWAAICYIKYKDGSKVKPEKNKYTSIDTTNSIALIPDIKKDSSQILLLSPAVSLEFKHDSIKNKIREVECHDADMDKGYHDADKNYRAKGIGLLSAASTFVFFPAGLTFQLVFRHTKPLISKADINDESLRKNKSYMQGYRLRAVAKRNIKMFKGFCAGIATLAAETGLGLYFKEHPSHGGGGGYHDD